MLGGGAGSAGSYVIVWVWPWYWYWYRVVAVRPDGFFLAAMRTLVENDRCIAPSAKNERRWSEDGKRFAEQNQQVVKRMNEMADRIDALESSILELVHGSEAKPAPAA